MLGYYFRCAAIRNHTHTGLLVSNIGSYQCKHIICEVPGQIGSGEAGKTVEGQTGVIDATRGQVLVPHRRRRRRRRRQSKMGDMLQYRLLR